ncbi:MAG: hypothetical protein AAFR04_02100 [Pseudomonadota bacterium]
MFAIAAASCTPPKPPQLDTRAGLDCVDDSPTCVRRRVRTLETLKRSRDRRWVHEAASPRAYASGVRLFALQARQRELTCPELKVARAEAERAPRVLARGRDLTPAQISRGKILAGEVARGLRKEWARRCGRR